MAEFEDKQNKRETRQVNINQGSPENLTNNIYAQTFLREYIGRLMKVEFLIGTNNLIDKTGILADVGENYILLRTLENDTLVYCDIYSIKFVTISATGMYSSAPNSNNGYRYY